MSLLSLGVCLSVLNLTCISIATHRSHYGANQVLTNGAYRVTLAILELAIADHTILAPCKTRSLAPGTTPDSFSVHLINKILPQLSGALTNGAYRVTLAY